MTLRTSTGVSAMGITRWIAPATSLHCLPLCATFSHLDRDCRPVLVHVKRNSSLREKIFYFAKRRNLFQTGTRSSPTAISCAPLLLLSPPLVVLLLPRPDLVL